MAINQISTGKQPAGCSWWPLPLDRVRKQRSGCPFHSGIRQTARSQRGRHPDSGYTPNTLAQMTRCMGTHPPPSWSWAHLRSSPPRTTLSLRGPRARAWGVTSRASQKLTTSSFVGPQKIGASLLIIWQKALPSVRRRDLGELSLNGAAGFFCGPDGSVGSSRGFAFRHLVVSFLPPKPRRLYTKPGVLEIREDTDDSGWRQEDAYRKALEISIPLFKGN